MISEERRAEAQMILSEYGFSFDEIVEITEPLKAPKQVRNETWRTLYEQGKSTVEIATLFKTTNQNVGAVLRKLGVTMRGSATSPTSVRTLHPAYGVSSFDELREYEEFRIPYKRAWDYNHWSKNRKPWLFTLPTWAKKWAESGHWKERGTAMHQFGMTQIDRNGPISPDNTEILRMNEIQARKHEW